jgi:hypothetical protein
MLVKKWDPVEVTESHPRANETNYELGAEQAGVDRAECIANDRAEDHQCRDNNNGN